jgi:hypothetical protein
MASTIADKRTITGCNCARFAIIAIGRFLSRAFMTRTGLFDWISLICLIAGGGIMLWAALNAIEKAWLPAMVWMACAIALWHLSSLFAKYAIAASGRQK